MLRPLAQCQLPLASDSSQRRPVGEEARAGRRRRRGAPRGRQLAQRQSSRKAGASHALCRSHPFEEPEHHTGAVPRGGRTQLCGLGRATPPLTLVLPSVQWVGRSVRRRGITSGSAAARWARPAGDTAGPRYDGVRGVHPAQLKHPDRRRGARGLWRRRAPAPRVTPDRGPGLSLSPRLSLAPDGSSGWEPWACLRGT